MNRLLTLSVAAILAALALAPAAGATTYALRPTSTVAPSAAFVPTPSGSTLDAVLNDDVLAPSLGGLTTYVTSTSNNGGAAGVAVAAPQLAAGETVTGARIWTYGSVGAGQSLYVAAVSGSTVLSYAQMPSGQAAAWFPVDVSPLPTADQLANFAIYLAPGGGLSSGAPTRISTSYLELTTDGQQATGTTAPPSSTTSGTTTGTGTGSATATAPTLAPAPEMKISGAPVQLSAANAVGVGLACPADAVGGCAGHVVIRLAPKAKRAVAARCARGCRPLGESSFQVAAGKSKHVTVKLARVARIIGRKPIRVSITVTSRDAIHGTSTATRIVTLRRA